MQKFNKFLRSTKNFETAKRFAQLFGKDIGAMRTVSAGLLAVLLASNMAAAEIATQQVVGVITAFVATKVIAYIAEFLRFKNCKKSRVIAVIDAFIEGYNASSINDIVKDVIGKIPDIFKK